MTLPRELILEQLATLAADHQLVPYARDLIPAAALVMIRVDEVTPTTDKTARKYTAALVIITPRSDPHGAADDELDVLLEDVLHVVDNAPGLSWTAAKRGTYATGDGTPICPAYEVTITVHTTHTRGT